jgi:hypothetical protein
MTDRSNTNEALMRRPSNTDAALTYALICEDGQDRVVPAATGE